jgi:hypothetical protein
MAVSIGVDGARHLTHLGIDVMMRAGRLETTARGLATRHDHHGRAGLYFRPDDELMPHRCAASGYGSKTTS